MTREIAEGLTNFELAVLLIENSSEYWDIEASELAETLDRSDTINELENLGLFDETFEIGDEVEVPEPNDSDIHNHSFVGHIISFRGDNAMVQDGDACVFEIELDRLTRV